MGTAGAPEPGPQSAPASGQEQSPESAPESGRGATSAQLQNRVTLFLKVLLSIDVSFYALTGFIRLTRLNPDHPGPSPAVLVLRWALTALLLGAWLWARRGQRSRRAMIALETVSTVILAGLHGSVASRAPIPIEPTAVALGMATVVISLRASIVPSTMRRTIAVGIAAATAAAAPPLLTGSPSPFLIGFSVILGSCFVTTTAVTSRVIYGLHREVSRAIRLGQYELGRKLGEGAMGVVYEARHVLLRRPTALKLLPIDKVGERTVARFEQEVQLTSQLEHPNTITVYDYGRTPDGQFYYAMEFLEGLGLDALVERTGPIPQARVLNILRQAARALGEAHAKGLIHRDIKPSNLMLCRRASVPDTIKVLDFGLVKSTANAGIQLTQADSMVGTPQYMAPEAIERPLDVGPPADIYSLGAVAYYLLTGTKLFDSKSIVEVCAKHISEEPPAPSESPVEIDHEVDALILRCLAKKPDERFPDGNALARAVERISLGGWSEQDAESWWDANATWMKQAPETSSSRSRVTIAFDDTKVA